MAELSEAFEFMSLFHWREAQRLTRSVATRGVGGNAESSRARKMGRAVMNYRKLLFHRQVEVLPVDDATGDIDRIDAVLIEPGAYLR